MQGTRIPDGEFHHKQRKAGDYGLTGGALWVVLPSGVQGRLDAADWTWTEQEDGSITAHPSIHDAPDGWHGWLVRGVWQEC